MKIAIGADHRGFEQKQKAHDLLKKAGHEVLDLGTHSAEACDYPVFARQVAKAVSKGEAERGILLCNSGIGMAMVANKVKGIRAALCYSLEAAKLSRQHNDANVLVLGANDLRGSIEEIVSTWLATDFEGGRHKRRVDLITKIENEEKGM